MTLLLKALHGRASKCTLKQNPWLGSAGDLKILLGWFGEWSAQSLYIFSISPGIQAGGAPCGTLLELPWICLGILSKPTFPLSDFKEL